MENPRNNSQHNATGIMLGHQPTSNGQYRGTITSNVLEVDTLSIVGVGSSTGRKKDIHGEGCLNIMGDTRICSVAVADNFITPPGEPLKDDVDTADSIREVFRHYSNCRCEVACEKRYRQNRIGLLVQELKAEISATMPEITYLDIPSGYILAVDYSRLVCILDGGVKALTEYVGQ